MRKVLKNDALENGNFILMCYQDVLRVLKAIQKGEGPPEWFGCHFGTCKNTERAAKRYGFGDWHLLKLKRDVVDKEIAIRHGVSDVDTLLSLFWICEQLGNGGDKDQKVFVDRNSRPCYPVIAEYEDIDVAKSYLKSCAYGTLYQGLQLEARISLLEYKCKVLHNELSEMFQNAKKPVTHEDVKKRLEDFK
ncbi:hypothetical protein BRC2024_KCUCJSVR_CDS_0059 [Acinetobacter phage vB_AbaM_KissB]